MQNIIKSLILLKMYCFLIKSIRSFILYPQLYRLKYFEIVSYFQIQSKAKN